MIGLAGYWLLPIPGQVAFVPGEARRVLIWPQVRIEPERREPGQSAAVYITDVTAWANVGLTVNGRSARFEDWHQNPASDSWTWRWTFSVPDRNSYSIVFYHDCDTGCLERTRVTIGASDTMRAAATARMPTKLCAVFADPERDWHNRSGWDVELTYALQAEEDYWRIDDLAERVQQAIDRGLRVLVRVDYDRQQSLPPAGDYVALDTYLKYVRRLARDARLKDVYGYVIGSGFNTDGSNTQSPDKPVTSEWYARVFNGYNAEATHIDNVVQVIRAENTRVQILVGPVRPWNTDQDGQRRYTIDVPWLNYMNTLVAALDESTQAKAAVGIPFVSPDGFAIQASGRPDAPEIGSRDGADEPRLDIQRAEWDGAQAGFRVYRDWLSIINRNPTTRGLPVYVTSTNTFTPDTGTPPAQNYPKGWLSNALDVINREPQIKALCWFIDDFPHDSQWDLFSLTQQPGRLIDAAEEFDALLQTAR
ncbi:MAG TPA: hypothetical protein VJG32_00645 [Anaerolineae bacterium]|nr:hypothetical protein [Anaerolineae bacterium]